MCCQATPDLPFVIQDYFFRNIVAFHLLLDKITLYEQLEFIS